MYKRCLIYPKSITQFALPGESAICPDSFASLKDLSVSFDVLETSVNPAQLQIKTFCEAVKSPMAIPAFCLPEIFIQSRFSLSKFCQ
jgi:hypothetical protein